MHAALTVRKLKPGSYDDWRKAWEPEEMPEGVTAHILRNVKDPDEVIAFGLFEASPEEMEEFRQASQSEAEAARQARMAEYVESTGADGVYEVVEVVTGAKV